MKNKPKILIVDDKIENLIALEKLLDDMNIEFIKATSGNEAITHTLEHDFAIALVDVQMPHMNGFEMVQLIHSNKKTKHLPVIFISGIYTDERFQIMGLESGAVDFITKPIVPELLRGKVTRLLELYEYRISLEEEISRRIEYEHALKESEKKYRLLADNASDIIWTMNMDMKLTFVSPSVKRIRGYSVEEAMAQKIEEMVTPSSFETVMKVFNKELENHNKGQRDPARSVTLQIEQICKDGSTVWCEIETNFIYNHDGNPYGVIGITRDISKRKKAEKELRIKNQAIDSSITAIALADLNGALTYVNISFLRMWGYDVSDKIIGKPAAGFWELREKAEEVINKLVLNGSWVGELSARKKDGSFFHVQLSASMVTDETNRPICMMGSFIDITYRRETEENLRLAKEAAEAASLAKSAFLANMSHELRTPLNSILGFSQFLKTQRVGTLNEKQHEYIQDIYESGEHLLEMVNDILDLSKIEAGKIEINKKPFNLNRMLSRSPSTIKSLASKKNIQMELSIQADIGEITADEVRIKQIIYNLLSNAIKFTDQGKKIGIEAYGSDDRAVITVWDEGMGISRDNLEKIFEPFEQVNKGKSAKPEGTGLGLSISRKLVMLHNGSFDVESKVGKGTRFTITLPGRKY